MKQERVKLTLTDLESYVVASGEVWASVIQVIEAAAYDWPEDSIEREGWLEIKEDFVTQCSEHMFIDEEYDD
jgi:hypothetical protein